MRIGEPVRILIRAGYSRPNDDTRFVGAVEIGTIGLYAGKHSNQKLASDGWHWIKLVIGGEEYMAPLYIQQFKLIDDELKAEGYPPAELGLPDTTEEKRGKR